MASTQPLDSAIYVNHVWEIFWPMLSDVGKKAKTSSVLPISPYPRILADPSDYSLKVTKKHQINITIYGVAQYIPGVY